MNRLFTQEGETLAGVPWNSYPRPQLVRDQWLCLNGTWRLETGGHTGEIRVPFCPESLLSGWKYSVQYGVELHYFRSFTIPESWQGKHIFLHFGAVNRSCSVAINGIVLMTHEWGYLPFSINITDQLVLEENILEVWVKNDLSHQYPWGKQKKQSGGMWYTPVSGIWQTVWLEPVPEHHISGITTETGLDYADISVSGVTDGVLEFNGQEYPLENGRAHISIPEPNLWSPDHPYLYTYAVTAGEDRVHSYFALRTISIQTVNGIQRICLNGTPYFFNGLLDQGYWSDGLYTPPSPESFTQDIQRVKDLGYNTLRKHIKVEPAYYYYQCDRLGMIVFQDMVNSGRYSYIRDTVLPTIGLQHRSDQNMHRDPITRSIFLMCMKETVETLRHFPCIVLWTIFNEGWGQFCADTVYQKLKLLDSTRLVNTTSGWFHQKKSDIDSLHIYFDKLHLGQRLLPQLLSEFGGYSWKIPEHSYNLKRTYGYQKYQDRESFIAALRKLYQEGVLPLIPQGLCGAIYTQVSDVEDETNGMLTYDRRVCKVTPEDLRDIFQQMQSIVRQ